MQRRNCADLIAIRACMRDARAWRARARARMQRARAFGTRIRICPLSMRDFPDVIFLLLVTSLRRKRHDVRRVHARLLAKGIYTIVTDRS